MELNVPRVTAPGQPVVSSSAASTAVFDTYELLATILDYTTEENFVPLQHVNKTWRKLIFESPKLRKLFCPLTPLRVTDFEYVSEDDEQRMPRVQAEGSWIEDYEVENQACYSSEIDIGFNPAWMVHGNNAPRVGRDERRILLPKTTSVYAGNFEVGQYITSPPISTICIFVNPGGGNVSSCSLRIDTGITIGDVIHVQRGLLATEARYGPYNRSARGKRRERPCYALVTKNVDVSRLYLVEQLR